MWVRVGTRVCTGAQPACPSGSPGSGSAEDGSGVSSEATPSSSPPASAEHSLCLGAALSAERNQIAGAAGRRTNIINPTAGIPGERCSPQPCSPPQPPASEVLASAGCLICRKLGGFGAELPHHLPSLASCLWKLIRASLSLVTLMMVLNFPTNTSPQPPWQWDFTGVLAWSEGTGTYLKRRKRKS